MGSNFENYQRHRCLHCFCRPCMCILQLGGEGDYEHFAAFSNRGVSCYCMNIWRFVQSSSNTGPSLLLLSQCSIVAMCCIWYSASLHCAVLCSATLCSAQQQHSCSCILLPSGMEPVVCFVSLCSEQYSGSQLCYKVTHAAVLLWRQGDTG